MLDNNKKQHPFIGFNECPSCGSKKKHSQASDRIIEDRICEDCSCHWSPHYPRSIGYLSVIIGFGLLILIIVVLQCFWAMNSSGEVESGPFRILSYKVFFLLAVFGVPISIWLGLFGIGVIRGTKGQGKIHQKGRC